MELFAQVPSKRAVGCFDIFASVSKCKLPSIVVDYVMSNVEATPVYEKQPCPSHKNDKIVYFHNKGLLAYNQT